MYVTDCLISLYLDDLSRLHYVVKGPDFEEGVATEKRLKTGGWYARKTAFEAAQYICLI